MSKSGWSAQKSLGAAGSPKSANRQSRRPSGNRGQRGRPWRRLGVPLAIGAGLVIGLAVLAIQGTHPSFRGSGQSSGSPGDFSIVAYQGDVVLGGKTSTFSRVFEQGKPVVLNFWAGACAPCRVEMPGFQRISSEFAGKVIVVGVDVGPFTGLGNHDDAVNLYTRLGIHYALAYAVDASPLQLYNVQGMPTTVFLTAKGQVVDQVTGIMTEDQLRGEIQQTLLGST